MKKIILASSILAAASFAQFSQAESGVISFTGTLNAATCSIDGGSDIALNMGNVSIGDLQETPTAAHAQRDVTINCEGATDLTAVQLKFDPAGGSGSDADDDRLLKTAGAGKGASIALLDTSNSIINLKNDSLDGALTVDDEGNGTSTLSLRAAFVKNADAPNAEAVTASLPFTMTYE